jgi:hypothetical protein
MTRNGAIDERSIECRVIETKPYTKRNVNTDRNGPTE